METIHAADSIRRALLLFAETVLRPVVRIVLRYGLSYPEFNQIARKLYVDVAMQEAEFRVVRGKRQYKSRVACLTGLSRKEVLRLVDSIRLADDQEMRSCNRAARVLDGWLSDTRYLDGRGEPLALPFRAASGRRSFTELVNEYSGDITPRAILDELKRTKACASYDDDEIRVINKEYVAHPVDPDVLTGAAMRLAATLGKADTELSSPADAPSSPDAFEKRRAAH